MLLLGLKVPLFIHSPATERVLEPFIVRVVPALIVKLRVDAEALIIGILPALCIHALNDDVGTPFVQFVAVCQSVLVLPNHTVLPTITIPVVNAK